LPQYASQQIAGAPEQANAQLVNGAIVGTLIGTGAGSSGATWTQMTAQQRYDIAYMQCMYAKGNQVPGYTVVAVAPTPYRYPPPPPPPRMPPR
jgi:hypothetical protein